MDAMLFGLMHSFGSGLAFAIGVFCGAIMLQFVTVKGRLEMQKAINETNEEVNERLRQYVANTNRMAGSLDSLVKVHLRMEERNHNQ